MCGAGEFRRGLLTEASVVQRNARAWLGLAQHANDAQLAQDDYAAENADDYVEEYVDEYPGDETLTDLPAVGYTSQTAIVRLRDFRDAATVGEYFRQEIPVIINLEDMSNAEATRMIDFVSGLIVGLRGQLERVSRRAFLITPADATVIRLDGGEYA
jgi:cell division inhibitor SepF